MRMLEVDKDDEWDENKQRILKRIPERKTTWTGAKHNSKTKELIGDENKIEK